MKWSSLNRFNRLNQLYQEIQVRANQKSHGRKIFKALTKFFKTPWSHIWFLLSCQVRKIKNKIKKQRKEKKRLSGLNVDDTNLYKVWKNVELLSNKYHWELLEYQTISFGKLFKLDPTKYYCILIGKKVSMTYFHPIKHYLKK